MNFFMNTLKEKVTKPSLEKLTEKEKFDDEKLVVCDFTAEFKLLPTLFFSKDLLFFSKQ